RSRIRPNDVLISIAGTIGRVGVVPETAPPMNCNQAVAIVRPEERLLPRYLARWLGSADAQAQMARAQVTATISNLSLGQIGELAVPVPPPSEQRRIADILDKADAIRRKRKESIALTEELLRSAFLEMFGDPVTNPKGWPVKPLGELADAASGVTKGKRYDGQTMVTLPYMRVANVQDGHLVLDEIKTITVSEEDGRRYQLRVGDVLLTEGGD
ncbi:MAG: restriction endonuclease subunit S, partial [Planctomycetales bacterium]|nr:restriction endonuclease subunit S [Planctomycetales bacterium]